MKSQEEALLPSLSPVVGPLSKEEKQARQRLHVKRTYYRKLHRLQGLRSQLEQLETQCRQLVEQKTLQEACALIAGLPDFEGLRPAVKNKDEELTLMKCQLEQQNEALRIALREYESSEKMMQSFINLRGDTEESDEEEEQEVTTHFAQLAVLTRDVKMRVVVPKLKAPVTLELCRQVAEQTAREMHVFRASPHFVTTGVSVLGWRDRRLLGDSQVQFFLEKTFHGISARQFLCRGWVYMSSPQKHPLLYSTSIRPHMFTIQRVDDDNLILLRVFSSPDGSSQVKAMFLVSRFKIRTGYAVIQRSLDPELMAPYETPTDVYEQWADVYTWVMFETAGENNEHCKFSFGGRVQSSVAVGSDAWMLEVLFIGVRIESLVVGPLFTLEG
ncbi:hypothetical protein Poli38472_013378 [Pythium oligandrum]|uniref:Uncharacterized protein n=1 Tax=Pythium oligandrum TaxID=41045 RepID=A0A8K1C7J6_PYTOL|nr:hypothetical protein Poli38472_013378 [Pythium oligandrum]|eukprot:TMW57904.1 hypothetical protein Poli38472_013378 [Pythium oligandrum]